ncbi:hypothetical protein IT413_04415 [Candidatus Peregrinibacteria bacterium]|nr:hypothetical protein [Candidatus Peregrinibacteria bacterium]
MPDQNKNSENSLEVVVKAIDGEALVLETPNGDLIHWPLNQLAKPLTLGKTLNLKLESTDQPQESPAPKIKGYVISAKDIDSTSKQNQAEKDNSSTKIKDSPSSSKVPSKETSLEVTPTTGTVNTPEDPKQTRMRKLLENILNG